MESDLSSAAQNTGVDPTTLKMSGAEVLDGFSGPGVEDQVVIMPTDKVGVYDVIGTSLTKRFVKMSECYAARGIETTPIDWC